MRSRVALRRLLTESCATSSLSVISGFYFSHPDSGYFGVTEIYRMRPSLRLRLSQGHNAGKGRGVTRP
ncbi:MAG: hypothetical protein LC740_13240 [Actinobacteria bacterium]|nr:hypothetical protein [Actinomycetota bacterium]